MSGEFWWALEKRITQIELDLRTLAALELRTLALEALHKDYEPDPGPAPVEPEPEPEPEASPKTVTIPGLLQQRSELRDLVYRAAREIKDRTLREVLLEDLERILPGSR